MRDLTKRFIADGILGGLAGGVVMAVWFFAVDALRGELPLTLRTLADATARFIPGASAHPTVAPALLVYFAAQMAAFALIGVVTMFTLAFGRRDIALFLPLTVFIVGMEAFLGAAFMMFGPAGAVALPWWKVMAGDLAAAAAVLAVIMRREPQIASDLAESWHATWGETITVACPDTGAPALIAFNADRGVICKCSNWPKRYGCKRDCVRARRRPRLAVSSGAARTL